jgi:hypothetical protein
MLEVRLRVRRNARRRWDRQVLRPTHDSKILAVTSGGEFHVDSQPLVYFSETRRRYVMANQLGRRYQCETCGTMVLCTKAGQGTIQCHDAEMPVQQPRKLPSSD